MLGSSPSSRPAAAGPAAVTAYNAVVASADRDAVVAALEAFFAGPPAGTAAVYLFGSVARAESTSGSDVDLAILFEQDPPRTLQGLHLDLADALQAALGRPVDLVVLNNATPDLVHRVLRDGILVCERNSSARIRFEVRLRNAYFDMEPVRKLYRRARTA
jgi:predicted nucleotidyltransferase